MIINQQHNTVQKSANLGPSSGFSIAVTGHAFKILSANLYSDRPLAIIRELCTNAWDSHVAAGNTDMPFDLQLPTSLTPELRVRDFGTGLTHQQIVGYTEEELAAMSEEEVAAIPEIELTGIYKTYFASTKNQSNDETGGLGLGCKSPFSYTDTFSVTAYQNGWKRSYSAYIQEDGCPAIVLLGEGATDEPNGMLVQVPISRYDSGVFNTAAEAALRWFPLKPTCNIDLPETSWLTRKDSYGTTRDLTGMFVVQGTNCYPIARNQISPSRIKTAYGTDIDLFDKLGLVLFAPIGAVSIAPSREALSYDQQTISWVEEHIGAAGTTMIQDIIQTLHSEPNWMQAQIKLANLTHRNFTLAKTLEKALDLDPSPFGKRLRPSYSTLTLRAGRMTHVYRRSTRRKGDSYVANAPGEAVIYLTDTDPERLYFDDIGDHTDAVSKAAINRIKYLLHTSGNKSYWLCSATVRQTQEGLTPGIDIKPVSSLAEPPPGFGSFGERSVKIREKKQLTVDSIDVSPSSQFESTFTGSLAEINDPDTYYLELRNRVTYTETLDGEATRVHSKGQNSNTDFLRLARKIINKDFRVLLIPRSIKKAHSIPHLSRTLFTFMQTQFSDKQIASRILTYRPFMCQMKVTPDDWKKIAESAQKFLRDPGELGQIMPAMVAAHDVVAQYHTWREFYRLHDLSLDTAILTMHGKTLEDFPHPVLELERKILRKYAILLLHLACLNAHPYWHYTALAQAIKDAHGDTLYEDLNTLIQENTK